MACIDHFFESGRGRKQVTREIVQHVQRIQAVLEEANVKLSSVISDVLAPSGGRILRAIIFGETDAEKLAALGSKRLGCGRVGCRRALCWNSMWRNLQRHEVIVSGGEVNW